MPNFVPRTLPLKLGALLAPLAVLALCPQAGFANHITNGNFSAGNSKFTSSYTFVANTTGACGPAGVYTIASSPNPCHTGRQTFAPPTGATAIMVINGAGTANVPLWSQLVGGITPNTDYYFSANLASNYNDPSPASLQFSINGNTVGSVFNATNVGGQWQQFYAVWNSGSATSANLSILNQNTALGGNDFSLTLIGFDATNPGGTGVGGVPEPGSVVLLSAGLGGLLLRRRKMKRGDSAA